MVALAFLVGCKFDEPAPSGEVYHAAVSQAAKRPGIVVKTERPKPSAVAPVPVEPVEPVEGPADGHREVRQAPSHQMLCAPFTGISQLGSAVRDLSDKATRLGGRTDDQAGILLEAAAAAQRVCVVLVAAVPGSVTLAPRRTAILWHRNGYDQVLSRKPELVAWLKSMDLTAHPTAPLRAWLYVDPESVKTRRELKAALELELAQ